MLAVRGIQPRHRFGQNFLVDQNKLRQIIDAAAIQPGEIVLEVGPGTGTLTEELLAAGAKVVAVEIDRDMAAILRERIGPDSDRWRLINEDVLAGKRELNPRIAEAMAALQPPTSSHQPPATPFLLVANLPYNVASPLLVNLALDWPGMGRAIVMVQREVADRFAAGPGGKDYGPLGIILQAACEIEMVTKLPPECFWPRPQIDSAVVRLTRRVQPLTADLHRLAAFVHELFQKRRKQIGTIVGRATPLPEGIDATARPEQLSLDQLIALAQTLPPRPPEER